MDAGPAFRTIRLDVNELFIWEDGGATFAGDPLAVPSALVVTEDGGELSFPGMIVDAGLMVIPGVPTGYAMIQFAPTSWLDTAKQAGLPPLGALHTLRHTFCSRLARAGAPAAAIQQLAGHSSYSTTARYVHLFEGAKESAIGFLEPKSFGDMLETRVLRRCRQVPERRNPRKPFGFRGLLLCEE